MALKPCRECKKKVSTEASTCPSCGVPSPTQKKSTVKPWETDDKHEVKVSLTFETSQSTLHLNRIRKPFLTLATKDGKEIKKDKKNSVKSNKK